MLLSIGLVVLCGGVWCFVGGTAAAGAASALAEVDGAAADAAQPPALQVLKECAAPLSFECLGAEPIRWQEHS